MRKAVLIFLLLPLVLAGQPRTTSIMEQMMRIETAFGVHFVYDASLPVDAPAAFAADPALSLKQNLARLFKNSGIEWTVKKNYVVLTRSKKAPSRPLPEVMPAPPVESAIQADTLAAASITGHIDRDMNYTQTGLTKLDGAAFQRAFATLSSPDVLKTLQALPGVASGTEMLSNLYVHGGDGSDNLFLLDGVPLYQICHLGGIFSAFNTDAIETLDFYKSGFPARYGGRTSSVVDITTHEGDFSDCHGTFALGLLDGRFQLEGPIVPGKTSFNVALRRSWADVFSYPASWFSPKKEDSNILLDTKYAFTDLNARVTHLFSEDNTLSAGLYWGNDHFRLDNRSSSSFRDGDFLSMTKDTTEARMNWGNLLISVDWRKTITDGMDLRLCLYGSESPSRLDYTHVNNQSVREEQMLFRESRLRELFNQNRMVDLGVTADVDWRLADRHHLRWGADGIWHGYHPLLSFSDRNYREDAWAPASTYRDSTRTSALEASLYLEDEMLLTPWLRANAGFRHTVYSAGSRVWNSLEPRLAFKIQCGPAASFKVSYAEMSQFSHRVATTYLDLPVNGWLPSGSRIPPMHSRQVAAGVFTRLPHAMHLNVEGWWKSMDNLIEYAGMNTFFPKLAGWEEDFMLGKGRSYGLEVDFGYETPQLAVNAFYTLSWSERFFETIWPTWYRDRNDNRHKLTLQANWRISRKWELYGAWNYHSGNRLSLQSLYVPVIHGEWQGVFYYNTPSWVYEEPNNVKLPDYHRLDLGMNVHRKTRRGNEVVWNVSIYNVYCRMNPLYASVKTVFEDPSLGVNGGVSFVGRAVGVIPLIPSFSYTLRF